MIALNESSSRFPWLFSDHLTLGEIFIFRWQIMLSEPSQLLRKVESWNRIWTGINTKHFGRSNLLTAVRSHCLCVKYFESVVRLGCACVCAQCGSVCSVYIQACVCECVCVNTWEREKKWKSVFASVWKWECFYERCLQTSKRAIKNKNNAFMILKRWWVGSIYFVPEFN